MSTYPGKKKRKRMTKFLLNEISPVDIPAQEPATLALIKRKDDNSDSDMIENIVKRSALTSKNKGHTHLVVLDFGSGEHNDGFTSWEVSEGRFDGHTHPWIRKEDGSIEIGATDGHTHSLGSMSKAEGESSADPEDSTPADTPEERQMTESTDDKAADAVTQGQLDELQKRLDRSEAINEMTEPQREYLKGLKPEAQDEFLTKSGASRDEEISKSQEADKVVYKCDDGTEIRKSDDPTGLLAKQARENDDLRRELKKSREETEDSEFSKRAKTELAKVKGEDAHKTALLRAVATIEDADVRKGVEQILKAANDTFGLVTKANGHQDGSVAGDVNEKLEALAKKRAEEKDISFAKAYSQVLTSDEGRALRAEQEAERRETANA